MLKVENLSFEYVGEREVYALKNIDLEVNAHEFLVIVGPSACGKTTLLNIIAGLANPSSGSVFLNGRKLHGISPEIGYVMQKDNLYPWRTLLSNVEFPLEVRGIGRKEREKKAESLIKDYGLEGFEKHYPHELSGGMKQRANIIRTLICDPSLILMDEPFGALDAQTRMVLQQELLDLWTETRKTVIFVTHDLTEAIALADRIVVFSARPGTVKGTFKVDINRPRHVETITQEEGFANISSQIWRTLKPEVRPPTEAKKKVGGKIVSIAPDII